MEGIIFPNYQKGMHIVLEIIMETPRICTNGISLRCIEYIIHDALFHKMYKNIPKHDYLVQYVSVWFVSPFLYSMTPILPPIQFDWNVPNILEHFPQYIQGFCLPFDSHCPCNTIWPR